MKSREEWDEIIENYLSNSNFRYEMLKAMMQVGMPVSVSFSEEYDRMMKETKTLIRTAKADLWNDLVGEMDLDKWHYGEMNKKFQEIYKKHLEVAPPIQK